MEIRTLKYFLVAAGSPIAGGACTPGDGAPRSQGAGPGVAARGPVAGTVGRVSHGFVQCV